MSASLRKARVAHRRAPSQFVNIDRASGVRRVSQGAWECEREQKKVQRGVGEEPISALGHERRLHARAYDLWASLLRGGRLPALSNLDPVALSAFGDHGVVIGPDATRPVAFLGQALRVEAGLPDDVLALDTVPDGSLLALLLARLPAMLTVEAPYGFEAARDSGGEGAILYRGMWLPFAGEDGIVAAALGVIGWKQVAAPPVADAVTAIGSVLPPPATPWGDGPGAAMPDVG